MSSGARGLGDESDVPVAYSVHACRWGQLYGGRQWRWPWSLTDSTGYTALHQAAVYPDASTCAALLATLKRMLPGEVPAAHLVWLHEQGTEGVTPCELFTLQHPNYDTGMLWEQLSAAGAKSTAAGPSQAADGAHRVQVPRFQSPQAVSPPVLAPQPALHQEPCRAAQ